jgi:FkbM family methyltransferase
VRILAVFRTILARSLFFWIIPRIYIIKDIDKFGSHHGLKFLCSNNLDDRTTFISCGVGEDISFEIELLTKYKMNVILVDPTPRSIIHYEAVCARLGQRNKIAYSLDGCQDPLSYDLSAISISQLKLVKKAIWNLSTILKFYPPSNETHVSYSLGNIQRSDLRGFKPIEVESTTLENLCQDNSISNLDILKLDIEGSALEVIEDAFSSGIFPNQILVEIEEISKYSRHNLKRLRSLFKTMSKNNYVLISRVGPEFVFLHLFVESNNAYSSF